MPVETPSIFAKVIKDHLELKQRNADLDPVMPLEGYRAADPFDNHPLFKTEEQARIEETMDGVTNGIDKEPISLAWPGAETLEAAQAAAPEDEQSLWSRTRDFDWGD